MESCQPIKRLKDKKKEETPFSPTAELPTQNSIGACSDLDLAMYF